MCIRDRSRTGQRLRQHQTSTRHHSHRLDRADPLRPPARLLPRRERVRRRPHRRRGPHPPRSNPHPPAPAHTLANLAPPTTRRTTLMALRVPVSTSRGYIGNQTSTRRRPPTAAARGSGLDSRQPTPALYTCPRIGSRIGTRMISSGTRSGGSLQTSQRLESPARKALSRVHDPAAERP